jgi:hypothetical protein
MGSSPLAIPTAFEHTKFPSVEERIKQLSLDRQEALAAHELARTRMMERRRLNFIPFTKGQKVWLDTRNIATLDNKKMKPRREGPFEIIEVLGPLTYRLKLPITWRLHDVFHAVLLKPYVETEEYGPNFPRPPPDIVNGEEEYEVERIIKHRKRGRGYQYLVKWTGWPISDASWEPEGMFENAQDILMAYRNRHSL